MELKNTEPYIFIITGKARHGKDTSSLFIHEYFKDKSLINLSYGHYIKEYAKTISDWDGTDENKPRELLQTLGTDIIRKNIDNLFFINRMIEDIKVYSYFYDIVTISDGRFKSEIDIPKRTFKKVISIRIIRTNFDNGLTEAEQNHLTEIDLDDYDKFDYTIYNDGKLEDLKTKIFNLMEEINNEC